jgi:hypothetical protein
MIYLLDDPQEIWNALAIAADRPASGPSGVLC